MDVLNQRKESLVFIVEARLTMRRMNKEFAVCCYFFIRVLTTHNISFELHLCHSEMCTNSYGNRIALLSRLCMFDLFSVFQPTRHCMIHYNNTLDGV
jgi:hypothetical protein